MNCSRTCTALIVAASFSGLAVAGCSDAQDSQVATPEATVTETVVRIHPDGTETVTQRTLSESQAAAELAFAKSGGASTAPRSDGLGTTRQAISEDVGCAGADLWMYDQIGGVGNRICFYGYGSALLSNYCRIFHFGTCLGTWQAAVKSYWPGTESGYFSTSPYTCAECFPANGPLTTASGCAQASSYVSLEMSCPARAPVGQ